MAPTAAFAPLGARVVFVEVNIAETLAPWLEAVRGRSLGLADFDELALEHGYWFRGLFERELFGMEGDGFIAVFTPLEDEGRPVEILPLMLIPE